MIEPVNKFYANHTNQIVREVKNSKFCTLMFMGWLALYKKDCYRGFHGVKLFSASKWNFEIIVKAYRESLSLLSKKLTKAYNSSTFKVAPKLNFEADKCILLELKFSPCCQHHYYFALELTKEKFLQ